MKDGLKTKSDHIRDAQYYFNKYIRMRDKDKPCISCGRGLNKHNTHASHFYSVGAYPNLRFNEDNVHASCDHCNLHLHGNIAEYSLRLPDRIGLDKFNKLKEIRNKSANYTTEDIKEIVKKYKKKISELK